MQTRIERIVRAGEDRPWIWSGLLVAALLAIYGPGIGRGFIKDDFVWIAQNRTEGPADLLVPFLQAPDFYRPVVALSFAADWRLFGVEPLGYGLTNLALLLAAAVALGRLAVALGLPRGGAFAAAAVWSLNFHGINMALLWISGRTSLLATLFALLAAGAFVRQRPQAAGWALLAMLSKEEAVLLPSSCSPGRRCSRPARPARARAGSIRGAPCGGRGRSSPCWRSTSPPGRPPGA